MSICVLSQNDKFDLRGGTVAEGWSQFLRKVRTRKTTRLTKCTTCALKSLCGMCPANGELENQDPEAPVEFLCQVAHLRAYAFGLPVPEHGTCECCPGGEAHEELMASARHLEQGLPPLERTARRAPSLTVAKASSGEGCGGGCTSCRSS
jgi:radical SAM protein with 4Fe4S-binding SPASM domain